MPVFYHHPTLILCLLLPLCQANLPNDHYHMPISFFSLKKKPCLRKKNAVFFLRRSNKRAGTFKHRELLRRFVVNHFLPNSFGCYIIIRCCQQEGLRSFFFKINYFSPFSSVLDARGINFFFLIRIFLLTFE